MNSPVDNPENGKHDDPEDGPLHEHVPSQESGSVDTRAPEPVPSQASAPEETQAPTPESTQAPEPEREPDSEPTPAPESEPASAATPAPETVPRPGPAPADSAVPEPVPSHEPTPEGTSVPEPEPTPEPEPEATPAPETVPRPGPPPVPSPVPAPEGTHAPEPEPSQAPVTEDTHAPEPQPEPSQAPTPEDNQESAPVPRPGPRPVPTPRPAPVPPSAPTPAPPPVHDDRGPAPEPTENWGRVADDGTVFVRTQDGERSVGQMPDASPEEALAFFTKRYDDLQFEVELLEQRVKTGALPPDEAAASVKQVHTSVRDAQAVGDLAGLDARLDALNGTIAEQREKRRGERTRKLAEAQVHKERIADEAERLSESTDWRNGANRLRQLLDEWKALPRLEKSVDDGLWRRFSTARTTYTRRRKSHFAELNEQRDSARVVKEKLAVEAETLASSTEWGPTAGKYRDLMRQWKAAGPAPKGVDDQLWKRFRGAQDTFFGARDAANAALDQEFAANAEKKEALLVEAEALLPVTDLRSAKDAFREIAERWGAAGKVPRERMKELEGRIRKVEQAIRGVEDEQWSRSNPEARARAADTVAQLESLLADLEKKRAKAEAAGNTKKAQEHADAIEARRSWLTEAQKALEDFS